MTMCLWSGITVCLPFRITCPGKATAPIHLTAHTWKSLHWRTNPALPVLLAIGPMWCGGHVQVALGICNHVAPLFCQSQILRPHHFLGASPFSRKLFQNGVPQTMNSNTWPGALRVMAPILETNSVILPSTWGTRGGRKAGLGYEANGEGGINRKKKLSRTRWV